MGRSDSLCWSFTGCQYPNFSTLLSQSPPVSACIFSPNKQKYFYNPPAMISHPNYSIFAQPSLYLIYTAGATDITNLQCRQQNKLMYNLHQYNSVVRMVERQQAQEQRYAKYVLKHQGFKEKAIEKQRARVQSFVLEQCQSQNPFVFEDDHYKHWRPLKQFRDIQDAKKFLAHKTFRHKPYYDMDKIFNERERREIKELSLRKESLVKSKIIPEEQRSRSLRCQGPLNPKIEFRPKKKEEEYLQPRLRFSNVTDRERMNETAMSYDDKFRTLYKSFEITKSRLGKASISKKEKTHPIKNDCDFLEECESEMAKSRNFYYEKEPSPSPSLSPSPQLSQNPSSSSKVNPESPRGIGRKSKTYFKLTKTAQLFQSDPQQRTQIQALLKRTQYDRKKDLSNLRYNLHHQNHLKPPIL